MKKTIKRNTLDLEKSLELLKWLGDRLGSLGSFVSYESAAAWAGRDLGYPVTAANVKAVAKAGGLELLKPKRQTIEKRVEELERRLSELEQSLGMGGE